MSRSTFSLALKLRRRSSIWAGSSRRAPWWAVGDEYRRGVECDMRSHALAHATVSSWDTSNTSDRVPDADAREEIGCHVGRLRFDIPDGCQGSATGSPP